ncbi:hypothetical protein [Carboxylicivirga sp. RSCT41]|uniref:hypothetical protein n=1 Tax=Carboxylicivirga agarovorans TaxID=3417570 RepID=UPI003D35846F
MINIDELVYEFLSGYTELVDIIDDKIFVIDIPENTSLPVVQIGSETNVERTRDKRIDKTELVIHIYSSKHSQGWEIMEKIVEYLDLAEDGNTNTQLFFKHRHEQHNGYSHIQTITFDVK